MKCFKNLFGKPKEIEINTNESQIISWEIDAKFDDLNLFKSVNGEYILIKKEKRWSESVLLTYNLKGNYFHYKNFFTYNSNADIKTVHDELDKFNEMHKLNKEEIRQFIIDVVSNREKPEYIQMTNELVKFFPEKTNEMCQFVEENENITFGIFKISTVYYKSKPYICNIFTETTYKKYVISDVILHSIIYPDIKPEVYDGDLMTDYSHLVDEYNNDKLLKIYGNYETIIDEIFDSYTFINNYFKKYNLPLISELKSANDVIDFINLKDTFTIQNYENVSYKKYVDDAIFKECIKRRFN